MRIGLIALVAVVLLQGLAFAQAKLPQQYYNKIPVRIGTMTISQRMLVDSGAMKVDKDGHSWLDPTKTELETTVSKEVIVVERLKEGYTVQLCVHWFDEKHPNNLWERENKMPKGLVPVTRVIDNGLTKNQTGLLALFIVATLAGLSLSLGKLILPDSYSLG